MSAPHPSDEIVLAAREHAAEYHRRRLRAREFALDPGQDGKAIIVWRPGSRSASPSFTCRLCPQDHNRFLVDVYAPAPTLRALPKIKKHFATRHGIKRLPLKQIAYEGNPGGKKKAVWLPATPATGAGFLCQLCPPGMSRIYVEPPPYGDARRTVALLQQHPELWRKTTRLLPPARAAYVEAWDRGLLDAEDAAAAERALAAEQRKPRLRYPRAAERPLQRLLLNRVRSGLRVSGAIEELGQLRDSDPVGFRCLVGEQVGELAQLQSRLEPQQFAAVVAMQLGHIEVSDRTFWSYWGSIPLAQREAAGAEGERTRPTKRHKKLQ